MATYLRPEVKFDKVFGRSGLEAIKSMDEAGDDIAQQRPKHHLTLSAAGVSRSQAPVCVIDPIDGVSQARLSCEVEVMTEVPPDKRGIHMSRMSDRIARLSGSCFRDLQEYASTLTEEIRVSQYGGATTTKVKTAYSYIEQIPGRSPDKDKLSLETIGLRATCSRTRHDEAQGAGVELTNITACPCVQQTLRHARPDGVAALPTLTHSQRCETSFFVERITGPLPLKQLLESLDRLIVRTRNTLPREYEALLVHRAHQDPQFMEDVVRQVLAGGYHLLKDLFPESTLRVSSRCMESIHSFDINCEVEFRMRDLRDVFSSEQR